MTKRVLLAAFIQETSSFNPVRTRYGDFHTCTGDDVRQVLAPTATEVGGALEVFDAAGVEVTTPMAAWCGSGGSVAETDLQRFLDEFSQTVAAAVIDGCDGVYLALHGAMVGESEVDPEGALLQRVREHVGDVPIVLSMDLHGILTDRMAEDCDAIVPFHTYPHVDQQQTGQRAARVLLQLLSGTKTRQVRIRVPMLVRGDELLTATGFFGDLIQHCHRFEADPRGLAAGVLIGNPFTDVPDLRSNVTLTVDDAAGEAGMDWARKEALTIARLLWSNRQRLQAHLTPMDEAIGVAHATQGLCVFSDAADATSSGASGDSNHILRALLAAKFSGRALLTIVDAVAVEAAICVGVGNRTALTLGGRLDPERHSPFSVDAYVKALGDGEFTYEDGTGAIAGRTAVVRLGTAIHVLVTERPVNVMGRRLFLAHGLDPIGFDLVSMKSPNGFRTHYESIASRIVAVDAPGSTSANLHSLPYRQCPRPIFPLDSEDAVLATLEFALQD